MRAILILVLPTTLLVGLLFSLRLVFAGDNKAVDVPPHEDPLAVDENRANAAVVVALALAKQAEEETKREEELVDAKVLALERQHLPYFARIFTAERSFIPRACEVTDQQRQELAKATDGVPRTAARKYAIWQHQLRSRRGGQVRGRNLTNFDRRTLILNELQKAVQDCLEPAQAQQYAAELAKRSAHRKRTAAIYLVAELDQRLFLTSRQRVSLTKSLLDNWQDEWGQPNRMLKRHPLNFPQIPNRLVVPFLKPRQRVVWHGTQKQNVPIAGGMVFGDDVMILNDFEIDIRLENGANNK